MAPKNVEAPEENSGHFKHLYMVGITGIFECLVRNIPDGKKVCLFS